jgi:hypothetical protein
VANSNAQTAENGAISYEWRLNFYVLLRNGSGGKHRRLYTRNTQIIDFWKQIALGVLNTRDTKILQTTRNLCGTIKTA